MLDIRYISAVIAVISIVIGVIYADKQLRDAANTSKKNMLIKLYELWGSEDMQKAFWEVYALEREDYENYEVFSKKYGVGTKGTKVSMGLFRVGWFFNGIGVLLYMKIADIDHVEYLFGYIVESLWDRMKKIVEGQRKEFHHPEHLKWFEYVYKEMKKKRAKTTTNTTINH